MPPREDKTAFLRYEFGILTIKASLATRTEGAPIYLASYKEHQRGPFKDALRKELQNLESAYSNGRVAGPIHCEYIGAFADQLSKSHGEFLNDNRMRFGVSQKFVNLYLKYLWVAGLIEEPPHCPVDGIIRDLASLKYDWTTSDSRPEYEAAIATLAKRAHPRSLSGWELQEFRRREQSDD